MNIWYILILVTSIFAAFSSGFYFGYLKREDKVPEMPLEQLSQKMQDFTVKVSESIQQIKDSKGLKDEDTDDKDSYFNA